MAREHLLVARRQDSGRWITATGIGLPLKWRVLPGTAPKVDAVTGAFRTAMNRDLSIDVTVSPLPLDVAKADPDVVPNGYYLTLICREGLARSGRWAILSMDTKGNVRQTAAEAGRGIHRYLENLAESQADGLLDRSFIWFRPDVHAEDVLPSAHAA